MTRYPYPAQVVSVRPIAAAGAYAAGADVTVTVEKPGPLKAHNVNGAFARIPVEGLGVPAWIMKTDQASPLTLTLQLRADRNAPTAQADLEGGLLSALALGSVIVLNLGGPLL